MQAVIIAGGLGTRLRPLTFNRPKALVPLLNRAQILHILERLPKAVDEVFVAVNYMSDRVREFFQEVEVGRSVVVVEEATPLGTGGAVKNVASRIDGTFAVYNGDVIDSLDFTKFLAFHRKRGGLATIALYEVPDPSAFGVVAMDGSRITRFVEKPAAGEAPSRLINAGRYIFEPEVLDGIEAGREVSMEREVFPALASKGLHGFPFEGYWTDAGTLDGYLAATRILLANGGAAVDPRAKVSRARLDGAVLVPEGCEVTGRVGPDVVLGPGCRVDAAAVASSVLLEGASVEAGAVVRGSIIGEDSSVGPGATVEDSIVGDGVRVRKARRVVRERMA
jgi:mannose-1-phosphate guanylyltransferase